MNDQRKNILFAALLVLLLAAAWKVRNVLIMIYVAALFAVVIYPAVSYVRALKIGKWSPSRGIAVLAIVFSVILVATLLSLFIAPPIYRDIQAFSQDLPRKAQALYDRIQHLPFGDRFDPQSLQQYAGNAIGGVVGISRSLAGSLFAFLSWLILTAYFIVDGDRAFHWCLSLFPTHDRERLRRTLERAEQRVSKWLLGQFVLMIILGTAAGITFRFIGLKYSLALGLLAGLANIIPIIGPLVSAVVASLVAVTDSWQKAVGVIVFYVVYQQIENALLTPRIMKTTVDLPALAVIIALSIGGSLAGVVGALVAVPTAALISVLIDEYLVQRQTAIAGEE